MALLKVAHLGHPILRQKSKPVAPRTLASSETQRFIDDLIETMREYDGVGLAAPQVHQSIRVVVYEVDESDRYPDAPAVPLTVLVNPVLTPLSEKMDEDWEGCLSVPDLRGRVPRHRSLGVRALDRNGHALDFKAKGFHARVVQHECDHLDGRVFLDRMRDLSSLAFLPEYLRYAAEEDEGD